MPSIPLLTLYYYQLLETSFVLTTVLCMNGFSKKVLRNLFGSQHSFMECWAGGVVILRSIYRLDSQFTPPVYSLFPGHLFGNSFHVLYVCTG